MAERTTEELLLEIEDLKKQSEAFRQEAEQHQRTIAASKDAGSLILPVPGSYEAKWKDAAGKPQKRLVEFKDGRLYVIVPNVEFLPQLAGKTVPSEALLRIANGGEATAEELGRFPHLRQVNTENAGQLLTHYAGIRAGFLK